MVYDVTIVQAAVAFAACLLGEAVAIYGGAGFIIQPALLAAGIPPQLVIANDASAASGASISCYCVFHRHDKIDHRFILWWAPGLILGSIAGIKLLTFISPEYLEKIIVTCSLIGSFLVIFKRPQNDTERTVRHGKYIALIAGLALGVWSGFSGMGSGSISLTILVLLFGQTIKQASINQTPLHVIVEVITTLGFLLQGWILWKLFIPMFLGCLAGGYIGAHIMLRLPEKALKIIFLASVSAMACATLLKH